MIVVDASIAVKWVIPETDSAKARTLQIERMAAPAIWLVEAANALWRHVRVSQLTEMEAITRLRQLRNAAIDSVPVDADIEPGARPSPASTLIIRSTTACIWRWPFARTHMS